MVKPKIRPRVLESRLHSSTTGFFNRLFMNQRFLAIVGLVFLVIVIFPLARTYSQRRLIEKEINDVKKQISNFENENQDLQELITYLQSNQSLEEQARRNLNLKKPGEQVVVIEAPSLQAVAVEATSTNNKSNLVKWWYYFFD